MINQKIYELTMMKLKSQQQMRNFNKNLDGNRNSDKSHLGLKMLHPRVQQSNTDKKGTDEPCELWRSSNPYIIWGRRPQRNYSFFFFFFKSVLATVKAYKTVKQF